VGRRPDGPARPPAAVGADAEAVAAGFLQQRGLRILHRNFRVHVGEIDLVAEDRDTLVFVEVRSRTSRAYGGAAASITARKQARIVRAAQFFLATTGADRPCRFDCVLLEGRSPDVRIEWIRDAFGT
jgi:putative endonuclease